MVRKLQGTESDRICGIQIINSGITKKHLYIISVYLPQSQSKISSFDCHLDMLEVLIEQCMCDGDVIVAGDFNCHFGSDVGCRFWGKTTKNAKQLMKLVKRKSLSIVDKNDSCIGPKYTFNVPGIGKSYIDHFLVSKACENVISKCEVLEDSVDNTSDHLAISCSLSLCKMPDESRAINPCKVAWHKMTKGQINEQYTLPLDKAIQQNFAQILSGCECGCKVDNVLDLLSKTIHKVSEGLPMSTFKKGLKPYWTRSLTELSKASKGYGRRWIQAGKPKDGLVYDEYKKAKRAFRLAVRQEEKKYELGQIDSINKMAQIDHSYF